MKERVIYGHDNNVTVAIYPVKRTGCRSYDSLAVSIGRKLANRCGFSANSRVCVHINEKTGRVVLCSHKDGPYRMRRQSRRLIVNIANLPASLNRHSVAPVEAPGFGNGTLAFTLPDVFTRPAEPPKPRRDEAPPLVENLKGVVPGLAAPVEQPKQDPTKGPTVPYYVVKVNGTLGAPMACESEGAAIALAEKLAKTFTWNQYCVFKPTMLKRAMVIETINLG